MSSTRDDINMTSTSVDYHHQQQQQQQQQMLLSTSESLLYTITMIAIILITIVGNILVVLSVFTYGPLKTAPNIFIASLAGADLAVAVLVMPFNVVNFLLGRWIFGRLWCLAWLTSDILTCTASILHLCAIAIDRYRAIHSPISYAVRRTRRHVLVTILIVWTLSVLISVPPLFGWNGLSLYDSQVQQCSLTDNRAFVLYSASGSFYIPLGIMTVVYGRIYMATRARLEARHALHQQNIINNRQQQQRYRQQELIPPSASISRLQSNTTTNTTSFGAFNIAVRDEITQQRNQIDDELTSECCPTGDNSKVSPNSDQQQHCDILQSVVETRKNHNRRQDSRKKRRQQLSTSRQPEVVEQPPPPTTTSSTPPQAGIRLLAVPTTIDYDDVTMTGSNSTTNFAGTSPGGGRPQRHKISLSKERKAARTMAIIMGAFVVCWLPFFIIYVLFPFCSYCSTLVDFRLVHCIVWLGYLNSALNPIIYTVFNLDFRRAFQQLLTGKCR